MNRQPPKSTLFPYPTLFRSLANNNLKSQLDVSFADVNVSEAKLLLLRAEDTVQTSLADLTRALGSDQQTNYQLLDEPRSEEHTSELQSRLHLVCRLLLEKKK